jgi:hypothetical protein
VKNAAMAPIDRPEFQCHGTKTLRNPRKTREILRNAGMDLLPKNRYKLLTIIGLWCSGAFRSQC